MPSPRELTHVSPAAVLLPIDTAPVIAVARGIRETWMTRTNRRLGAIQTTLGSVVMAHETKQHADLRAAVESALPPEENEERVIRLRLITDAQKVHAWRAQTPGVPNNTLHTDFWVDGRSTPVQFRKRDHPRIALVIDGDTTRVTSGTMYAPFAEEFTANGLNKKSDPEQQMAERTPTLYGADGQLIRGPIGSNPSYALRGNYTTQVMPPGQWYALDPATAHEIPPELATGRMILSVDRVD